MNAIITAGLQGEGYFWPIGSRLALDYLMEQLERCCRQIYLISDGLEPGLRAFLRGREAAAPVFALTADEFFGEYRRLALSEERWLILETPVYTAFPFAELAAEETDVCWIAPEQEVPHCALVTVQALKYAVGLGRLPLCSGLEEAVKTGTLSESYAAPKGIWFSLWKTSEYLESLSYFSHRQREEQWAPFEEDGFRGETNRAITPERMVRVGAALASVFDGPIGISSSGTQIGKALLSALCGGILAAGGEVWDFGDCFESAHEFCLLRSEAAAGVFVDANFYTTVKLSGRYGFLLTREEIREMEQISSQPPLAKYRAAGRSLSFENLRELYGVELLKTAYCSLSGMEANIKCANARVKRLMEETLRKLGCILTEDGITLQLSADGKNVSAYRQVSDYLSTDEILSLIALEQLERGEDLMLPRTAPHFLERTACQQSRKTYRWEEGPCAAGAVITGKKQLFLRDGLMLGVRLLCYLRSRRITLLQARKNLPQYAIASRMIPAAASYEQKLGAEQYGRGVRLNYPGGEVFLRPARAGKALWMTAESSAPELAAALCDEVEEKIKAMMGEARGHS